MKSQKLFDRPYDLSRDSKMDSNGLVKHVVLDSGAFLRNAPVQSIGEKVYTIPEVIEEIKDKATKQRLQVLPYELIYREPAPEAIKAVTDFSKKTGDYGSLSAVDIRVMALTLQLEKEHVGTDHIKVIPEKKIEWGSTTRALEKPTDIAGFYLKPKKISSSRTTSECSTTSDEGQARTEEVGEITVERLGPVDEELNTEPDQSGTGHTESRLANLPECDNSSETQSKCDKTVIESPDNNSPIQSENSDSIPPISDIDNKAEIENLNNNQSDDNAESNQLKENQSNSMETSEELREGDIINEDCLEEDSSESEDEDSDEEDDDDDDGGGWITPSNIRNVKEKMGMPEAEKARVPVGCLTTDFAMQNVLIQMGLNVISVDGMLIKRAKSYVLRCFACMKITTNVQKVFCPHCGNKTLTKVSMTVNEDGSIRYFLSRRQISKRGKKFPLPLPKGGKHGVNPHLVEDQPHAQQRITLKARNKLDVFDTDYVANQSPFMINDVTSRAAQLGIRPKKGQTYYWERKNPNASRPRIGRKKRKD